MRVVFFFVVGAVLALPHASAAGDRQPELVAPVISAQLRCEPSKPEASALVTIFQNPASADTAVVLGIILANGRVYLPIRLKLRVRQAIQPHDDELPYGNLVRGGRVDSWIVPLPAGSSFMLSVPLRHFISTVTYTTDYKRFVPGGGGLDVRVVLDAKPVEFGTADAKLMKVWVGTLTSNHIHIPNECIDRGTGGG